MKGLIVCLSVFLYKHHLQSHINVAEALHGLEQVKVLLERDVLEIVFVNKDRSLCWHQEHTW